MIGPRLAPVRAEQLVANDGRFVGGLMYLQCGHGVLFPQPPKPHAYLRLGGVIMGCGPLAYCFACTRIEP